MPRARSCLPTISPTVRSISTSQLAARPSPEGKLVAPGRYAPHSPSMWKMAGIPCPRSCHRRGLDPVLERGHVVQRERRTGLEDRHHADPVREPLGEVGGLGDVHGEVARDLGHLLVQAQLGQEQVSPFAGVSRWSIHRFN